MFALTPQGLDNAAVVAHGFHSIFAGLTAEAAVERDAELLQEFRRCLMAALQTRGAVYRKYDSKENA